MADYAFSDLTTVVSSGLSTSFQAATENAEVTLSAVAGSSHAAFTTNATLQAAIRNFIGSVNPGAPIANAQFTIVPSDGETHTVDGTSYPVMGKLYVPTGLAASQIDVLVVFHGTVTEGGSSTIAQSAVTSLNYFLNSSGLNCRDLIIFSAAYPQDHISRSRQFNISGVGTETSTFLMGDNIVYARAAVGWVKNSLNAYIAAQGGSKTIGDVYLFGHSQGGKLVTKMNTIEDGIAGVVANAPGPIQFDQTCAATPSNTSCSKVAAIHGASTGDGSAPYKSIGLEEYTYQHKAPILFTQAIDDGTGNGNQYDWLVAYIDTIGATAGITVNTIFADSELGSEDFTMSSLTTLERGWNAPGRPQTGQMYPR
tara:strand:+ start:37 stop:1140 length:1104 start_codon:yes stop_codon:yes gene_type:complete